MDVSVRELKNHLSEYLRRVRAGEELTITLRGRPVARFTAVATGDEMDAVARLALIQRHPLRTYDALHLAAAMWVRRTASVEMVRFACCDSRLCGAAFSEGLRSVMDFPA